MSATSRNDCEPLDGSAGVLRDDVAGARSRRAVRRRLESDHAATPSRRLPRHWNLGRRVLDAAAEAGWTAADAGGPARRPVHYEAAELREPPPPGLQRVRHRGRRPRGAVRAARAGASRRDTPLSAFEPTHVLIAPTLSRPHFPELAATTETPLAEPSRGGRPCGRALDRIIGARVVQHGFVVPDETPLGHLAARLPASRITLGPRAQPPLGASGGLRRPARRHRAPREPYRQAALARPAPLVRGPPAVRRRRRSACSRARRPRYSTGDVGLAPRCLVLDLDNTLWGGVVGEEGPNGIAIGQGPEGEATPRLQEYLKALNGARRDPRRRLEERCRRRHANRSSATPRCASNSDDFAAFVADWRPKSEQLTEIAATLGLGLESLVFVDDNPAEVAQVTAALPAVRRPRPRRAAVRARADARDSLRFELSALSKADLERSASYAARAQAVALRPGRPRSRTSGARSRCRPGCGRSTAIRSTGSPS